MPDETPTPPAPPAPAEPTYRVEVPPEIAQLLGEDLPPEAPATDPDALTSVSLPAPVPAPAPALAPAPAPAVAAAPPPPTPRTPPPPTPIPAPASDLSPAMAERLRQGREIAERVGQHIQTRRRETAWPIRVQGAMTDAEWQTFGQEAMREITEAVTGPDDEYPTNAQLRQRLGNATERIFARLKQIDGKQREALAVHNWRVRVAMQEEAARRDYEDYDDLLEESGVAEAIPDEQTGVARRPNQAMLAEFYRTTNPAAAAYSTAVAILAQRAGVTPEAFLAERRAGRTGPGHPAPISAGQPVPPVAAAPAPPAATGVPPAPVEIRPGMSPAEAARAATQAAVDRMATTSARPRGLRDIEPAGEPQRAFSRPVLERLMEHNYDAFRKLMDANPDLEMWFMTPEFDGR